MIKKVDYEKKRTIFGDKIALLLIILGIGVILFFYCLTSPKDLRLNCLLPKETGVCKGYFPRFYYNIETDQCEPFIYGGCGANGNNFNSIDECSSVCLKNLQQPILIEDNKKAQLSQNVQQFDLSVCNLPKEIGRCKAAMFRTYYNAQTKKCEEFIYGGCGGNQNNFGSKDECVAACEQPLSQASKSDKN